MKPRLYLSAFLLSFICSLFFTSCGGEVESTSDENKTVSKGIIGVSVLTLGNPFFSVIADNVTREAANMDMSDRGGRGPKCTKTGQPN